MYPSYVKTPQTNGNYLTIHTYELEDAVKMLGFYHYLDASKSGYTKEVIDRGDWLG